MDKRQRAEQAGRRGESLAALFLQAKGYRLLERRYKSGAGEIDLIFKKGKCYVFAEVKHRLTIEAGLDSVTAMQANRIMNAADLYIAKKVCPGPVAVDYDMRFDLIITGAKLLPVHIKDAFRE